ncbi:MAG: ribosome biogenesis GTPase Der [Bacteroidota bacterium]
MAVIAIVGRPNVGKSTLFNRLVEQRKAITHDESGTTRDRHYGHATWNGKHFIVVDTGGYVPNGQHVFEQAIRQQAAISMQEAQVILFMVDAQVGITSLDQDMANVLRMIRKPILVVANKADNTTIDLMVHEFYKLGMGNPYAISSASGMGTGELLDKVVEYCATDAPAAPTSVPKIAIIGRPNVGKSSLLNVLVGQPRSIVAPTAGTTRDTIDTSYTLYNKHCILTDTAGLRKKHSIREHIEFYSVMRSLRALQEADVCLVIIDAEKGLERQDVNLIALAHRYKKGIVILVNKWDLITKHTPNEADRYRKEMYRKLAPLDYIPILFVSTVKKQRIYQAMEKALEVYAHRNQRVATAQLNKVMLQAIERYTPPAVRGKYIKIKYVTQLPTRTPVFAFFCNHPQYVRPAYKSYLEKQLRAHFDLHGVPIQLVFRQK